MYSYIIQTLRVVFFILYLFKATRFIFTNLLAQMYNVLHPSAEIASPSETYIGKYIIKISYYLNHNY